MNAITRLRQARNPDQLAAEIEPLAQALASLSDELQTNLKKHEQASLDQAEQWEDSQKKTAKTWSDSALEMRVAAEKLFKAAHTADRAASGWNWKLWLGVLTASIAPILVLLIASWLFLEPQIHVNSEGISWLVLRLGG